MLASCKAKITLGPNYNQDQVGMFKKLIPIHPHWFKALNPKILNPRFKNPRCLVEHSN